MMKSPNKSNRITVSLTDEDHKRIEHFAVAQDVSLSWVVRKAVGEFLDKIDKFGESDYPAGTTTT